MPKLMGNTNPRSSSIVPQNETEEVANKILNMLRGGALIGDIDTFGMLQPISQQFNQHLKRLIHKTREAGKLSDTQVLWLTARRGGGKSETIGNIKKELRVEKFVEKYGKSIVASVDLKQLESKTGSGLQRQIFNSAVLTSTSPLKKEIDAIAEHLINPSESEKKRENIVNLGLDIGFSLLHVAVPGISGLGKGIIDAILRKVKLSQGSIKKELKKRGITSPEMVQLLVAWMQYSIGPNDKNWKKLEEVYQPLANDEKLFAILCKTFELTNFSTLVLLFDEADELIQNVSLTKAFERLWDPPKEDYFKNSLNKVFVLAITENVDEFANETIYGGFTRRFLGPQTNRNPVFKLVPPRLTSGTNTNDDFAHGVNRVTQLLGKISFDYSHITDKMKNDLKKKLLTQQKKSNLTWHELWASVCDLYYPR